MEPAEVQQIAAEVEALAPGETFGAILVDTMSASQRADVLDSVQLVLDELRQRGHRPTVTVRRSEHGEVHALSLR